jgi:hypothetical protein
MEDQMTMRDDMMQGNLTAARQNVESLMATAPSLIGKVHADTIYRALAAYERVAALLEQWEREHVELNATRAELRRALEG